MKKALLIFYCLILLSSIPLAYAQEWQKTEQTGDWTVCNRTEWKQDVADSGSGSAEWQIQISNFTGYFANITFSNLESVKDHWWDFATNVVVGVYWVVECLESGEMVSFGFQAIDSQSWWGAWHERKLIPYAPGLTEGITLKFAQARIQIPFTPEKDVIECYFWVDSEQKTLFSKILLRTFEEGEELQPLALLDYEFGFNQTSQFSNVKIKFHVSFNRGIFSAKMTDKIFYNEPYSISVPPTDFYREPGWWEPIANIINTIKSWVSPLFELIVLIGGYALGMLAYLPIIFVFWLLDAIITAVMEGNFQPLGNAMMTIYNTVRGLISTLASIANTVKNWIKWW